ncbi:MAG: hypothetical protein ACRC0Y_04905, partial [Fusobacteriaceae bacterium]
HIERTNYMNDRMRAQTNQINTQITDRNNERWSQDAGRRLSLAMNAVRRPLDQYAMDKRGKEEMTSKIVMSANQIQDPTGRSQAIADGLRAIGGYSEEEIQKIVGRFSNSKSSQTNPYEKTLSPTKPTHDLDEAEWWADNEILKTTEQGRIKDAFDHRLDESNIHQGTVIDRNQWNQNNRSASNVSPSQVHAGTTIDRSNWNQNNRTVNPAKTHDGTVIDRATWNRSNRSPGEWQGENRPLNRPTTHNRKPFDRSSYGTAVSEVGEISDSMGNQDYSHRITASSTNQATTPNFGPTKPISPNNRPKDNIIDEINIQTNNEDFSNRLSVPAKEGQSNEPTVMSNSEALRNQLTGNDAVRAIEEKEGITLTETEKYILEEEGYVDGQYYDDRKENPEITSGVGQTGKFMNMSFREAFNIMEEEARKAIPEYNEFPQELKNAIMSLQWRGDLQQSPKFRKLINAGRYREAAVELLNHEEYNQRRSSNPNDGVVRRLERTSSILEPMEDR